MKTNNNYDDIINLPHKVSTKHPQMSRENRAAQFAPFAALVGYDDTLKETRRLTADEIYLSEDSIAELDRKLAIIQENIGTNPLVEITYFIPDNKKQGGQYLTISKNIKRIDTVEQKIIFNDKSFIYISDIVDISSDLIKE